MPVEEDKVGFAFVVDHLVDPDQSLDRRPAAALVEWVEIHDSDHPPLRRRLRLERPTRRPAASAVPANLDLR
jgi:hypothetical protein